jgi:hypothetical protein
MYKLYWLGKDFIVHETSTIEEMKEYLDNTFERDVGPVTVGVGSAEESDYYTWEIVDDQMRMKLWERAENYMGENFYEYFVFLGKHRDSDPIDVSNFRVALKRFDDDADIVVARSNHWLVGWIEVILIHQSDEITIGHAEDILAELENYPVLDHEDYERVRDEMGIPEEE